MNLLTCKTFDTQKITIYKPKLLQNKLILFPIKYNQQSILLKSPYLTFQTGIQQSSFSNKQFITFSFPDIFTKKHIGFYKLLLELTKWLTIKSNSLIRSIQKKQLTTINKDQVSIKKIIDDHYYEPRFTMNLYKQCIFFNNKNEEIDFTKLNYKQYQGKLLCMISSIWFYENKFGFSFHCLQLQCTPIITKCLLTDKQQIEINKQTQQITCPYCDECILLKQTNNNSSEEKYKPYLKMKQVGVPLMAIKLKLQQQQLNYQDFLSYSQTNLINVPPTTKKTFSINDLLKQKKKLIKKRRLPKIKPKKYQPKKYQPKKYKVPSLQEILSTLHSLKPVKY